MNSIQSLQQTGGPHDRARFNVLRGRRLLSEVVRPATRAGATTMKLQQGHTALACCVLFVLAGLAMLAINDLREAGWYCLGGGLIASMLVVFLNWRVGPDAPPPPLAGPPSLPKPSRVRDQCPTCGSAELRVMNASETKAFYGYDRFVLYLPRRCLACGHAFEVHPGVVGCYFLAGFSALGVLFGLFLLLLGPFLAYAMFFSQRPMEANPKLILGMIVAPVLGALTVWRFSKETLRYWRLRVADARSLDREKLAAPGAAPDPAREVGSGNP
jgi:hypothetical protein